MTGRTSRTTTAPRLHGRGPQLRALAALSDRLPERAGVLVVTGEPGIGRTALLDHAAHSFPAGPVHRPHADPAPGRRPYGGLRAVLRALDPGGPRGPADPEAGAGVLLAALRAAAGGEPLLLCVDDVHLWDGPSLAVLGRAARRLTEAGPVVLLTAAAGYAPRELAGLPTTHLLPLSPSAAAAVLDDATGTGADQAVRDALLEEADGNPALLLALAGRLSCADPAGSRPLPAPPADPGTLTAVAGPFLRGLPPDADGLLLVTAAALRGAEGDGGDGGDVDAGVVGAALSGRGLLLDPLADASPALLLADGRLRFAGAVLRRAVYAGAAPDRRRAAHLALARVLEGDGDRLRALLHRAWAATGADPELAAELTAAASDPRCPAPHRLRSLAHARAAELTTDEAARGRCRTAAAGQALHAGLPRRALELLDTTAHPSLPDAVRGRAELLRGSVQLLDGPTATARESLLTAAALLAVPAPELSAVAGTRAMDAAWAAGDLPGCLEALSRAPRRDDGPDDYHRGLRSALEGRLEDAVAPLERVVASARDHARAAELARAAGAALVLGDLPTASRAAARAVALARADGDRLVVPRALEYLAYAELRSGRHPQARTHAEEGLRAARAAGQRNTAAGHRAVLALVASIEGVPAEVAGHAGEALDTARRHGLAQTATLAQWALGRADLGRGRPLEAADRLGPLVRPGPRRGHFAVWMLAVPCFVEVAVLAGRESEARHALEDLAAWSAFGADPQAPAQLLRCRALLAPPDLADELYTRALDLHERATGDFERARTALLYGKWLRRRRRLREARDLLGAALVGFESCGARVWADQARGELRAHRAAAPGTPRAGALDRLTPQQCRIARHVADGATNREVARILSVSTRTVDYHLRKVFAALGVRSRVELVRLVEQAERPEGERRGA
ncbi:LuxR C-terminal-related transcriptional regulator [Streptomyces sp. NPDC005017]|uniref:helix-turn-helix transcriptional regulator n=1 Tax=Streptomyces sp. NPDC005017 TaxID=3364706 RepID=UPI003695F7FC